MSSKSYKDFESIYAEDAVDEFSPAGDGKRFVTINSFMKQRPESDKNVSKEALDSIQKNFHNLIRYRNRGIERIESWLTANEDILPIISKELLDETEPQWFSVGGMYGGFSYGLIILNDVPTLVTESWIRIVGGSGQQHMITADKVELVARGFV